MVTFLLRSYAFSLLVRPILFNDTNTLDPVVEEALRVIWDPSGSLSFPVMGIIVLLLFATKYFSASKGS